MFIEKISFNTSLTPIEISEILKEKTKPLKFMMHLQDII